jgi:predicted DNA repair protein MutK
MASGFFALLDDIAVLAKAAATSLDDVAVGAGKSASKTAAVLIDDAAVSPQYVQGLSPKRELPVVWKIALGSFRNKFLFVIPAAMILSWLAPGVLPYLLILGGSYLAFEGAEKVLTWFGLVKHHHKAGTLAAGTDLEKSMVASAVRTDLILSTEIMLISLASVDEDNWIKKLLMLFLIGFLMTIAVYGAVGLLVKLDDIGLHMAQRQNRGVKAFGTGIIKVMPNVFKTLTFVGTLAMLWVGGHLVWKSLGDVGVKFFADSLHGIEEFFHHYHPLLAWLGDTAVSTLFGFILGAILFYAIHPLTKLIPKKKGTEAETAHSKES